MSGYIDVGIEKNSESYANAIKILESNQLSKNLFVEHSLNNNYLRIPVANKAHIKDLSMQQVVIREGTQVLVPVPLTKEQYKAIESVYDLYSKDNNIKKGNISLFMDEWNKRENLKVLKEWWDNIPTILTITSAGKVLAHSNAQRCDKNLPPLD